MFSMVLSLCVCGCGEVCVCVYVCGKQLNKVPLHLLTTTTNLVLIC